MSKTSELKWFSIFQYDLEEEYLEKKHRQGLTFQNIGFPLLYKFRETTPQEMNYKIEYGDLIENKAEYIIFLEEYGWEYITEFAQFMYFRKPTDENAPKDDIFTDKESKMQHLNRILKRRGIMILLLLYPMLVYSESSIYFIIIIASLFLLLFNDYIRIRKKILSDSDSV